MIELSVSLKAEILRPRERKARIVEELSEYVKKYEVLAIADFKNIGAREMQLIRKELRGVAVMKVAKNTLMKLALKKVLSPADMEKIEPYLRGQNVFIFTDMNPFELNMFLEEHKVATSAEPGDIAPEDIYIYAGNTGLPPGPILSKFGALKIPTKIEEGSIFVLRDTLVVRKGEVITADMVEVFNKLDIKPIKIGLSIKAVYYNGRIIPHEELTIDLKEFKERVITAYKNAVKVSLGAVIPVDETTPQIISTAHINAIKLAIEAGLIEIEDIMPAILAIAVSRGRKLAELAGVEVQ